jgi:hypothetical protein
MAIAKLAIAGKLQSEWWFCAGWHREAIVEASGIDLKAAISDLAIKYFYIISLGHN